MDIQVQSFKPAGGRRTEVVVKGLKEPLELASQEVRDDFIAELVVAESWFGTLTEPSLPNNLRRIENDVPFFVLAYPEP